LLTFLLGGYLLYSFVIREPEKTDVSQNSNKAETNSGQTDNSANPQNTKPSSDTEAQMILVEGGSFEMGRNDVPKTDLVWGNQYPAHTVPVKSFSIDKTEVSNEKYSEFVQASGHPAPSSWKNGKPPRGDEKYPVTNVSLSDAKAYADWFSKRNNKACRLPTEEEWEFAARNGSQQTSFPWGNDWRAGMANIATGRSAEVGTSSDETLAGGIKDMLGSVIEWTSSEYALYGEHPGELVENRDLYVVRGSSWGESEDRLNNAQWLITRRQSVPEQTKSPFLGFRLVCQP
jgi:formylglycine-generating enzyme required for sulfatase activity